MWKLDQNAMTRARARKDYYARAGTNKIKSKVLTSCSLLVFNSLGQQQWTLGCGESDRCLYSGVIEKHYLALAYMCMKSENPPPPPSYICATSMTETPTPQAAAMMEKMKKLCKMIE